ncbi:MAG: AzlD domain-containing protein [Alphaproteobacteria bacterium]|nr:MAG: AzlD domain-containing protein [Alphaproteobacteria bacterium]
MINEPLTHGALIGILAMAGATLMTRVAGYWLMGHIPLTRRVRRCLEILPGAIMAATIVPIVAKVGPVALIAVIVAAGSMMIRRNEFIAVGLAVAAASFARAYGL